jgi:hypothetical protein
MKKPLLLLCLSLISLLSMAQALITGQVTDAETKEPLAGASIFAQNTTRGTVTNKDGQFELHLEKGGYELVISYTGYTPRTINLDVTNVDRQFNLALQKADNSLSEVVIRSSNEVPNGWEKYGKFFTEHFIGATPNADSCSLANPQALKFFYFKRTDRLKVLATEPLQIVNRSLGYQLRYDLDSFVYYFQTDMNSYRGRCFYTPLDADSITQAQWKENRRNAYYGSRVHFLRSYYDSTLRQEGFTVDVLSSPGSTRFSRLANPYDTAYYYFNDSVNAAELWFPEKACISYIRRPPEKQYLQTYKLPASLNVQASYVDLSDGILIQPNGYFTEQKSWTNQGYWSWKKMADQLPYDYEPDK